MADLNGKKIELKYFGLSGSIGGRGHSVRCFLYYHDIDFVDTPVVVGPGWLDMKKELVTSGDNPCGRLPVIYIDDKPYFGHIPLMRLLSRKLGVISDDPEVLYISEILMDEYTIWRGEWVSGLALDGDANKTKEYGEKREEIYELVEKIYQMRPNKSSPHLMGLEKAGYDDIAIYSLIHDDMALIGELDLTKYPSLKAVYDEIKETPKISKWLESRS